MRTDPKPASIGTVRQKWRFLAAVFSLVTFASAISPSMSSADAARLQVVVPREITVQVAINVVVPAGVTGYNVEALCNNVPQAAGQYRVGVQFGVAGGTGVLLIPVTTGVSCNFRIRVLGTGPRPLVSNGVFVGGVLRPAIFPTTVDGVAVDANTVVETGQIPVEAPTRVIFADNASLVSTTTAATTTTLAPTTTTTSTTRPPTTTPVTTIAPVTIAPTVATVATTTPATVKPPSVTAVPPRSKLVKVCVKRIRGKCTKTKLVRR